MSENNELTKAINILNLLHEKKELIESSLKETNKEYAEKEKEILDMLDSEGIKTIKTSNGIMVTANEPQLKASFKEGKKEEAVKWLKDNDLGYALYETVNHNTLNRVVKEKIEAGNNPPEELFGIFMVRRLIVRKGENK